MLISCDICSLVIGHDGLWRQALCEDAVISCFYFDFGLQKGQSPTVMRGSVLKQVLDRQGEVTARIVKAFRTERGSFVARAFT